MKLNDFLIERPLTTKEKGKKEEALLRQAIFFSAIESQERQKNDFTIVLPCRFLD